LIDLRSDTVTKPTPAMREAMAEAEVGNAAYGEDPTVNRLEQRAAELLGMENSLYVPSGIMANQIAIKTHTHHGEEVIVETESHIFHKEIGAMAALSGVLARPIQSERGVLPVDEVESAIRPRSTKEAQTGLICLENTHNRHGGTVYPVSAARGMVELAHSKDLPIHLDGARILNAAVAAGVPCKELGRGFDSVMFCLSKGLGAPVGSVLVGSRAFIAQARRFQKMFGGAMRQAGVIAAAGLYAIENNIERLEQDHANARELARSLTKLEGMEVNNPETNIVILTLRDMSAAVFTDRMTQRRILVNPIAERKVRLVTHLDVSRNEVLLAAEAIREVIGSSK
jgi:threonine aldolase